MGTTRGSEQADVLPPGAALTFGVLGPLELRVGDQPWEVHGGRERMVLAMLLTAPGRVVSVSSLVAGLWGDDPPGGADKAVQTYVSRLRGSLPGHGDGLVLTRSPGYVVAVAPDQVDAERFRRLASAGRHQLATGSAEEAGSTLRAALDLWRGEAYMEFDAPFAALARTTLEEERVAALADRIEAELALGQGPELVGELESLVSMHPWQERLWAQLMIALYRSGRQSDALLAFQRARSELRDELGVDPGPELRAVEGMVLAQDPRLTAATSLDDLSSDGARQRSAFPRQPRVRDQDGRVAAVDVVCPFKGLAHYEVEDAPYFFGRARLVDRLITRLVDRPLLAVVGPSGSGKSSVLRAGVVARIRSGVLPGSQDWRVVLTHPADARPEIPEGRALIVVDAVEEMFTALTPSEQAAYAEWLVSAAASTTATVVVALRADYYGRLTAHPALAELVAANTVPVAPMSRDELREAIRGPVAAAGLSMEPGLENLVAAEVVGEPGALPLLSAALLTLWEGRRGGRLTLAAYQGLGGVRSAVARLGERFYSGLSADERPTARRVLVRLAEVGADGPAIRRRVSFVELGPETDSGVRSVLDALATSRLVTLSHTHVEVAHEALLREWPRLRAWLDDDEAGERLRRRLAPVAVEWEASGRPDSELYRGQRLATALEWLVDRPDRLTALETEFIAASETAAGKADADRLTSVRRLRLLVVALTATLLLAAVLGVVARSQRDEARVASNAAEGAELEADVRAMGAAALVEPRLDRALLMAAQAHRLDPTAASRATLLAVAQRSPEVVAAYRAQQRLRHVSLSGDGRVLAAVGREGDVYVWDTGTGDLTVQVDEVTPDGGHDLDVSPDGRSLVVVGIPYDPVQQEVKGQAIMLDLTDSSPEPRALTGPALTSARFTADGRRLVTLGLDGRLRTVDPTAPRVRVEESAPVVGRDDLILESTALETSSDRRLLVAVDRESRGPVSLIDTSTGEVVWSRELSGGAVAAVDPDGTAVALGRADGTVELVPREATRGGQATTLSAPVVDLTWSPDGREVAGATRDGTVTTWDATTMRTTRTLRGPAAGVSEIAYSPDGRRLYASSDDAAVLAWDVSGGGGLVRDVGGAAPGAVGSLVSADASLVATVLPRDVLRLFEPDTGEVRRVPLPRWGGPAAAFTDRRGELVGYLSLGWPLVNAGRVHLVDVGTGTVLPSTVDLVPDMAVDAQLSGDGEVLVTTAGEQVVAHRITPAGELRSGEPYQAASRVPWLGVDLTGRRAALSEDGDTIEIVDLDAGRLLADLDPAPGSAGGSWAPERLAFSPDGRWFAAGTNEGQVVLWETEDWSAQDTWVAVPGGAVDSLVFTEDSESLIVGGGGAAVIRDVEALGSDGVTLDLASPPSGDVVGVGARRNGDVVVTHTDEDGALAWQTGTEALMAYACRVAGRDLTEEEWATAMHDRAYSPTCH